MAINVHRTTPGRAFHKLVGALVIVTDKFIKMLQTIEETIKTIKGDFYRLGASEHCRWSESTPDLLVEDSGYALSKHLMIPVLGMFAFYLLSWPFTVNLFFMLSTILKLP